MDQQTLVCCLQEEAPSRWPAIWGAVYIHRAACLRRILEVVDQLLADPAVTRRELRRELADAVATIEESGP